MRRSTIDRQREKTRPQCQTFCGQMRDVYPPKNPPEIPSKCSYPPLSVAKMVFASHRLFLWFVLLLWLLFPHFFMRTSTEQQTTRFCSFFRVLS